MLSYFKAEWLKTRKIAILSVGLIFLALSSFIGLANFFINYNVLIDNQMSRVLWGQLTFYNAQLLFPAMLAIFSVMIIIPEFERKTLEMLRVNCISIPKLIINKLVLSLILVAAIQGLLFLIYLVTLLISQTSFNISDLLLFFKATILSIVGSSSILMIHYYIVSKTKNFAKSVGIAAIGSFIGFIFIMLGGVLNKFFPYSQPMIALRSRSLDSMSATELIIFILVNIFYTYIFYRLTVQTLVKKQ